MATWYVSSEASYGYNAGNDSTGTGSAGSPYASIAKATSVVASGDTVVVNPAATPFTGTLANSTTVTGVTWSVSRAPKNGDTVLGVGIPAGTTIASGGGTSTVTLSQAATASGSAALVAGKPYAENSGNTGYLDIGSAGTVTGDTALFASAGGPIIQAASSTSRVVNVSTNTNIAQNINCCIIDMQNGASRQGIAPHQSSIGLALSQVTFHNANAQYLIGSFSAGTGTVTLDRLNVAATCNMGSAPLFGFLSGSSVAKVVLTGGTYSSVHSGSNACLYVSGATLTSLTISADAFGGLVTFNGTCGYHVRLHNLTATTLSITGTTYGSMPANLQNILIDGGTANSFPITAGVVSNNTFPVAGGLGVQLTGVTCSSFTIANNTASNNYGLASVYCSEYSQSVSITDNTCTFPNTFNGGGNYNGISAWGPGLVVARNTITAAGTTTATLPSHGIDIVADGIPTDSQNVAAATGTQNLGAAAGNVNVSMSALTVAFGSTGRFPQLAAFECQLQKQGSPTGNITCAVYSDSAGSPGTLLATSTTTVAASALSTSAQWVQFYFDVATPVNVAANTRYHYVLNYSGTVDGTNYVKVSTNSTVTNGFMNTGTSAPVWTQVPGTALTYIVATCCWGVTPGPQVIDNSYVQTAMLSETGSPENEGINVSASAGAVVARNLVIAGGWGVVLKNSYGAAHSNLCYGNLVYDAMNSYGGVYAKASRGWDITNNTVIIGGASTGHAVQVDGDSLSVFNHVGSVNTQVKNNILVATSSSGTAAAYGLGATTQTGTTIDNNLVYLTNGNLIEGSFYNTASWSAWQALGYDVHGIGPSTNPLLNSLTPASASDFYPTASSPAIGIGTDLRATAPVGYDKAPFLPKATAGGYSWFTGELLCEVASAGNVYALIWNAAGQIWNVSKAAFEQYQTVNLTSYAIGLAQAGAAATWRGNFPPVIVIGCYDIQYRVQAGGSPAEGDAVVTNGRHIVVWTGAHAIKPQALGSLVSAA